MRRRYLTQIILAIALVTVAINGHCETLDEFDIHPQQWRDPDIRDKDGLKRDTWYFFGYQWVTIGLLYMAPESVSGWSDEQKEEYDLSVWWDNVTHPQMDSDDFYINYILHPYWGAAYYVRAQERGYNARESFWYSVFLSSAYELGAEALFEEPSIQDLIVTPVVGSMLGHYFMRLRDGIHDREDKLGYRTTKDKWLMVLTDPLGALNRQVDKLTGQETRLEIRPYRHHVSQRNNGILLEPMRQNHELVYGLEFRLQW